MVSFDLGRSHVRVSIDEITMAVHVETPRDVARKVIFLSHSRSFDPIYVRRFRLTLTGLM